MSMLDVFNSDVFGVVSLTASIQKLPELPSRLGDMGIFKSVPINTTAATIEEYQGKLSLVQTSARGTRGAEQAHAKRKVRSFVVPHIQVNDAVKADEVQNVRDFGSEGNMQSIATIVNNRLQSMKDNIDVTKEWHRAGAIQGNLLDADGSTVIYNWFTEFGVTQQTYNFDFAYSAPAADVKKGATAINRLITHTLGRTPFTKINAICGDDFWDAFISAKTVKDAYQYATSNEMLQNTQRDGFNFGGITWWNYSAKIGSTFVIPTANAFFVPVGAGDLFQEHIAPADYNETVNTLGQPYYAKQEPMPMGKGIEMEAQANVLYICNRPSAVVKGTFS
jgi:hypothetical protein